MCYFLLYALFLIHRYLASVYLVLWFRLIFSYIINELVTDNEMVK